MINNSGYKNKIYANEANRLAIFSETNIPTITQTEEQTFELKTDKCIF